MKFNPFKKPSPSPTVPEPAPIYTELRNRILTLKPAEIGISPSPAVPHVWGVLMEMGHPQAVITLVSLADGTTSLYFSNGGGILGGGEHEPVAQASQAFVASTESYFPSMAPAPAFPLPLPAVGDVKFYVLTFEGIFTAEANEQELGNRQHVLSPLFYHGQAVITQIRLMQEQKK